MTALPSRKTGLITAGFGLAMQALMTSAAWAQEAAAAAPAAPAWHGP